VLVLALFSPVAAGAQALSDEDAIADEISRRQAELAALTENINVSADRRAELEAEIAALERDRATLVDEAVATAGRIQALEASLTETEERLMRLGESDALIRDSLDERRDLLAEVLGTLQRMGRRPPPALVVQPEDALQAVRSAMLLGAVVPSIRIEVEALASDLAALAEVRASTAEETERLRADAASLADESARRDLLIDEKRRLGEERAAALAEEQSRAEALASEALTVEELITGLEERIESARAAAEAAEAAASAERPSADDAARLAPAVAFAEVQGRLPLPVRGVSLLAYGESDGFGGRSSGLSVATRAGAQVTAPSDAWVAYAGPFRSYGQLLILNAGDGYHVLLAGMDSIDVELGQFVLAGEPVGVMGSHRQPSAAAPDVSITQPVLYIEFRKDGVSIDPAPWWAAANDHEGRG
jgi:septal ring factor EnvC (AmiA/AmiB activator)